MKKNRLDILLVEDEPANAQLVQLALEDMPVNLYHKSDGAQAWNFLQQSTHPDLILLDIHMPVMDGWQFLRQIKEDPILSVIPVVMFTNSDSESDIRKSYQYRAVGYVIKPSDIDEFFDKTQSLIYYWLNVVRVPEKTS